MGVEVWRKLCLGHVYIDIFGRWVHCRRVLGGRRTLVSCRQLFSLRDLTLKDLARWRSPHEAMQSGAHRPCTDNHKCAFSDFWHLVCSGVCGCLLRPCPTSLFPRHCLLAGALSGRASVFFCLWSAGRPGPWRPGMQREINKAAMPLLSESLLLECLLM